MFSLRALGRLAPTAAGSPDRLAVFFGTLPSMEEEIDCKLQSNSS